MDEFEVLIALLVGVFKLIAWIFRTLFGGVRALARLGRGPEPAERDAPPRMLDSRAQPQSPAPGRDQNFARASEAARLSSSSRAQKFATESEAARTRNSSRAQSTVRAREPARIREAIRTREPSRARAQDTRVRAYDSRAQRSAREPMRLVDPSREQQARASQPLRTSSFVAVRENRLPTAGEVARYKNEWEVPPPPPPGSRRYAPPRRRISDAPDGETPLSLIRDAIVLDALLTRRAR